MTSETVEKILADKTIRVGRHSSIYRPYYFNDDKGTYKVHNIIFYSDNGIIFETNQGWLEYVVNTLTQDNFLNSNLLTRDIEKIYINELTRRSKENFTRKENFYIPIAKKQYDNDKQANLYIYVDNVNIKINVAFQGMTTEDYSTQIADRNVTIFEVTGMTYEPIMVEKVVVDNFRQSNMGKLIADFKAENSYPLSDISDYTLSELFKKYTLIKK